MTGGYSGNGLPLQRCGRSSCYATRELDHPDLEDEVWYCCPEHRPRPEPLDREDYLDRLHDPAAEV